MRILWLGESPWKPSGYGVVTREIAVGLTEHGHNVEILSRQHKLPAWFQRSIRVWPMNQHRFGPDVVCQHLIRMQPHFLITLGDIHHFDYLAQPEFQRRLHGVGCRWIAYYPVDASRADGKLPETWRQILKHADGCLTMSRFGQGISTASGLLTGYLPHGVDLGLYSPPLDKTAAKRELGYDSCFVILSDARNQPRKMLPRTLDIFKKLIAEYPRSILHLHCDPNDPSAQTDSYCYSLLADTRKLGLDDHVYFTRDFHMGADGALSDGELAKIYASADVHLLASHSEGFGLPSLQAAAAGVVPLSVAGSASWELVHGHGVTVPPEWTVTDGLGFRRYLISREAAVSALLELCRDKDELLRRSAACRRFATAYSWSRILTKLENYLEALSTQAKLPPSEPMEAPARVESYGVSAFTPQRQLTIPVRPAASICPEPGRPLVLYTTGNEKVAGDLKEVFPGTRFEQLVDVNGLVTPGLVRQLLRGILVIGPGGYGDLLEKTTALLGIPYYGSNIWWPHHDIDGVFMTLRCLLTDHGLSEWRCAAALRAVLSDDAARKLLPEILSYLQPTESTVDHDS